MKIALITAGGAGMFCGSCMQDNTLVRALRRAGADAVLVPTYTPIRVDEENVSTDRVFLGGINVYLDSALPGWRFLPAPFKRWLDRPALIRLLARLGNNTDAAGLGRLTLDLLNGTHGPQRRECTELINFLCGDLKPDLILFSNALLSGIVQGLKQEFTGPIVTLLQGDDIFLEGLPDRYRRRAIELVSRNCRHFDGILTHSNFYAEFMQHYLMLPPERMHRIPLTIDTHSVPPAFLDHSRNPVSDRTVGYFARICPEKGVDRFLDCMTQVLPQIPHLRAVIAGYLPKQHHKWFTQRLHDAQLVVGNDRLQWQGSPPGRQEKFDFLRHLDLLFVPSVYEEPKGLYVLEAALAGVPALLPDHGAFPERIKETGCGQLFRAGDNAHAIEKIIEWSRSETPPDQLNTAAMQQRLTEHFGMDTTGQTVLSTLQAIPSRR